MLLRLSQQLAKKIKVSLSKAAIAADDNPLSDWHVRNFSVNRVQYIMATNSASLYTVLLHGKGINDENRLIEGIGAELLDQVSEEFGTASFQKHLVPVMKEFQFSKSNNRQVIGSMNEFVVHSEYHLIADQLSPRQMASRLNRTPWSMHKYKFPVEVFGGMLGVEVKVKIL